MAVYQVNYRISSDYTVYVEATNAEEARDIVEEIYQENFDILPEDGELDHEIDLGIYIAKPSAFLDENGPYTIEDAWPKGRPAQ